MFLERLFNINCRVLSTHSFTSLRWCFQPPTNTKDICGRLPGSSPTSGLQPSSSPPKITTSAWAAGRTLHASSTSARSRRRWRLLPLLLCKPFARGDSLYLLLTGCEQLHQPCWHAPRGTALRYSALQSSTQRSRTKVRPRPYRRRHSARCLSRTICTSYGGLVDNGRWPFDDGLITRSYCSIQRFLRNAGNFFAVLILVINQAFV